MRHRPPRSVRRARPPKPRSPICSLPGGGSRVSSRLSTRASRRCDSPRSAPSCPRRGIPTSRMRTERIWRRSKRQCIIAAPPNPRSSPAPQGRKDPERLSADDAKGLSENAADFAGVLVDYKAKGYTLDYLGTEDIDGTQAHKLRVTRPNGDVTYVYLDPDYFLEIRAVNRRIEHGVPNETVVDYGDYEKVAGVYVPFAVESGPKGSSERVSVQVEKAEANVAAESRLFQFPAAPASAAK